MSFLLRNAVLAALDNCDRALNDPSGDGTGEGAIAPEGAHYEALRTVILDTLHAHREPFSGSATLLRALLHNYPDLKTWFAHCGYKFGIVDSIEHALNELTDGEATAAVSVQHLQALVAAARSHAEDLASGLAEGIYEQGRETLPPLHASLEAADNALRLSREAIDDQAIIMAFGRPFDPALVRIERKRFSTTQGEVEVFYDGQRVEQWFDDIQLKPTGAWEGYSDAFWIAAARKWRTNQALLKLRGPSA